MPSYTTKANPITIRKTMGNQTYRLEGVSHASKPSSSWDALRYKKKSNDFSRSYCMDGEGIDFICILFNSKFLWLSFNSLILGGKSIYTKYMSLPKKNIIFEILSVQNGKFCHKKPAVLKKKKTWRGRVRQRPCPSCSQQGDPAPNPAEKLSLRLWGKSGNIKTINTICKTRKALEHFIGISFADVNSQMIFSASLLVISSNQQNHLNKKPINIYMEILRIGCVNILYSLTIKHIRIQNTEQQ